MPWIALRSLQRGLAATMPSPKATVAQQQLAILSDVVKGLTDVKILFNATENHFHRFAVLWGYGIAQWSYSLLFWGNECKKEGKREGARCGSDIPCVSQRRKVPDPLPDQCHRTRWCYRKAGIEVFDLKQCQWNNKTSNKTAPPPPLTTQPQIPAHRTTSSQQRRSSERH